MTNFSDAFRLAEKVALVTGGGSGIGRSTAIAMGEAGAHVAVVSLEGDQVGEVVRLLQQGGCQAIGIVCDLTQSGAAQRATDLCTDRFGRLDILVNIAGIVIRKRAEETLPEDWDKVLEINLKAVAEMCRAAMPHLRKNPGSSIINMSSITGTVGTPLRAAYAASRAAVLGYTRVLARELAEDGIRVNAVQPGFVDTPFLDPSLRGNAQQWAGLAQQIALQRLGTPEEIAWPIVFLASSAASYITGQAMVIDGGKLLF